MSSVKVLLVPGEFGLKIWLLNWWCILFISSPRKDFFFACIGLLFQNHYSKGIVTRQGKCQLKEKKMAALINQSGGLKLFAKLSFIKPAIDVIDEAIIMIICLFALRVLHSLLHSFKDTFFYLLTWVFYHFQRLLTPSSSSPPSCV